ncbi:PspC domain-containing protein [Solicola sp. PLA-1-18]|uniref:PspC domain-containing protein n=1 Tax=Solicola sp. PLA-1-18 TaxID=3380532 RepID=UPI003B763D28
MTTSTTHGRPVPRAVRPAERRVIGGVARGIADNVGVDVVWVRLAFVVATWFGFAGVIAYAVYWRVLPIEEPSRSGGLDSAARRGLRTQPSPSPMSRTELVQTVALLALGFGVVLLLQVLGLGVGPGGTLFVPLLVGVAGVAVIWRQADDDRWSTWVVGTTGWEAVSRRALGALLVVLAAGFLLLGSGGFSVATDVVAALAVALVGVALILGPWIYRLTTDLTAERRERIRSQERADVAAHLHDSVLQTLALLQKNAHDPATVGTLARRQERELRAWLYGEDGEVADTLRAALTDDAADVEEMHRVPIEVVGVGDVAVEGDPDVLALVRAAREAMTNAAQHSGAARVDVYLEVGASAAEVFVRDRGTGFDRAAVGLDRMGVRGSIEGRMERHGGVAEVRTAPGEGTEVRLSLPLRRRTHEPEHQPEETR